MGSSLPDGPWWLSATFHSFLPVRGHALAGGSRRRGVALLFGLGVWAAGRTIVDEARRSDLVHVALGEAHEHELRALDAIRHRQVDVVVHAHVLRCHRRRALGIADQEHETTRCFVLQETPRGGGHTAPSGSPAHQSQTGGEICVEQTAGSWPRAMV